MTDELTRLSLFRAMSLEELADVRRFAGFRPASGSMEAKLFVLSAVEAADIGRLLFRLDFRPFAIVEAEMTVWLLEKLQRLITDGYVTVVVDKNVLRSSIGL